MRWMIMSQNITGLAQLQSLRPEKMGPKGENICTCITRSDDLLFLRKM